MEHEKINHHAHRLAKRMLDAEQCTSREEAQHILKKAKKHKKKLTWWRRALGLFKL
jgi:hypothetical protein